MNETRNGIFLFLILINSNLFAQKKEGISVSFYALYQNTDLVLDSFYHTSKNDSILFQTVKFYVSNVEFLKDKKTVWSEKNSFHLIDFNKKESRKISLNPPQNILFNTIKFYIGIDSNTNVSGAMGGDLDPTKGMYWTWQNGYINFKIEGKSTECNTRNNEFQFHIGGYQNELNTIQTIVLPIQKNKSISIGVDIEKILERISLSKQHHIMSPNPEAVVFSEHIPTSISILKK